MSTCFERFCQCDVLAQADMLEADITPCTWCNPRRKLEVFSNLPIMRKVFINQKSVSIQIFQEHPYFQELAIKCSSMIMRGLKVR